MIGQTGTLLTSLGHGLMATKVFAQIYLKANLKAGHIFNHLMLRFLTLV